MDKLQWVKELVLAEQQMEESGMIDIAKGFNAKQIIQEETIDYLRDLKATFTEVVTAFNELKRSELGKIKIYGISNTIADFMLFRNGLKLVFSAVKAGEVIISFQTMNHSFVPSANSEPATTSTDSIQANWGAYGQLIWKYKGHPIELDYLVRYYLTRFTQESAR